MMKIKPVFLHIRNTSNLGDLSCCPADGFPEFDECDRLDWRDWKSVPAGTPLIFGGGGLFMKGCVPFFRTVLDRHPVCIWGAGLNYPHAEFDAAEEQALASVLERCAWVGVRNPDFARRHDLEFVPCPSAMSPIFVAHVGARKVFDVLAYEHHDRRFAGSRYHAMTNYADSFSAAVGAIAASGMVVTNSYHGAYWSSLLGCPRALWNPEQFGNRFDDWFADSVPVRVTNFAQVEKLKETYYGAYHTTLLYFARERNILFCNKVLAWLGSL